MTTYESVLQSILGTSSAATGDVRDVAWITDSHVIGVARDHQGRVEVFLVGAKLNPVSSIVKEAVAFGSWHRDNRPSFEANRLLFPTFAHFDQVAAFICTELLRAGADQSLGSAFFQTEPIIELAIERLRLTDQEVLGLAGELLLLDALCRHAADNQIAQIITRWDGWKKASRDFSWGSTGVEVKTTTRSGSSHLVEGVHQVDLRTGSDEEIKEDRLFLVSIGLEVAAADGNAFTIPQLVDRILARMIEAGVSRLVFERFLAHVAEYGASSNGGYDHGSPMPDPSYSRPFFTSFFRLYDMADNALAVLRREDVAARHHVEIASVRFRVDLPTIVSFGNPVSGANQAAKVILYKSLYS